MKGDANAVRYFHTSAWSVLVSAAEAAFCVIEARIPPESQPSFQITRSPHARVLRVIEAAAEIKTGDGQTFQLATSAPVIVIPPGLNSILRNTARQTLVLEIITSGISPEQFILDHGSLRIGQPLSPDLADAAHAHGMEVLIPAVTVPDIQRYCIPRVQNNYGVGI